MTRHLRALAAALLALLPSTVFAVYVSSSGFGQVWTAAIAPLSSDNGAALTTADSACLAPSNLPVQAGGTRTLTLGAGAGAGTMREGYVEVLEMASFPGALPSCEDLIAGATGPLAAPQGYLYGMETLINVMNGMDFTENAAALANLAGAPYFRVANDPYPSLTAAEIGRVAAFMRTTRCTASPCRPGSRPWKLRWWWAASQTSWCSTPARAPPPTGSLRSRLASTTVWSRRARGSTRRAGRTAS